MMEPVKKAADTGAAAAMGQTPVELSHPIHPATVHWPIAFLTASFSLDTLQHFTPGFFERAAGGSKAGVLAKFIPPASTVSALSVYSHAAGIAFAGVSIATGLGELYGMWKGQAEQKGGWFVALKDAYTADSDDLAANKLKTTITHASMNDAVVGIAVYNLYKRATSPDLSLPKFNAVLSAAALPLLLYSAALGGKLVYDYAVGVQRQGEGLDIKRAQSKSQ